VVGVEGSDYPCVYELVGALARSWPCCWPRWRWPAQRWTPIWGVATSDVEQHQKVTAGHLKRPAYLCGK